MNTDIDKHRRLAADASPRPWGISKGMLVSVYPTGLKLAVADCDYENGTANLHYLANIVNDHSTMLDEIERLRERNAKLERVLTAAEPCVDVLRDIAGDGHGCYLDEWDAAVDAAKEATNG